MCRCVYLRVHLHVYVHLCMYTCACMLAFVYDQSFFDPASCKCADFWACGGVNEDHRFTLMKQQSQEKCIAQQRLCKEFRAGLTFTQWGQCSSFPHVLVEPTRGVDPMRHLAAHQAAQSNRQGRDVWTPGTTHQRG